MVFAFCLSEMIQSCCRSVFKWSLSPLFFPCLPGFWAMLLFNSFLAYFVNLTNFLVTRYTSALTLQVLGNAKGVVAVVVSVLCFRNPVTLYSMLGYGITVAGVVLYSQAKRATKRTEAVRKLSSRSVTIHAPDVEQPKSPFVGGSGTENSRMSSFNIASTEGANGERQPLLKKGNGSGAEALSGDVLTGLSGMNGLKNSSMTGAHSRGVSSSGSDRLLPRGFSSIFEA